MTMKDKMDACTYRLSDYLDDEDLGAGERAAIAAHLEACPACRQVLADLQAVAARATTLPDRPPAVDLWPGIARGIGSAGRSFGIGRFGTSGQRRGASTRVSFTIPQLVAAGLALMALSAALVWMSGAGVSQMADGQRAAGERPAETRPVPANFADAQYDEAVADLERALDSGRHTLDPQTVRVLEENLRAIDRAIEQSRAALGEDPANLFLNTHLAATRKRKLELLRSAAALTTKS